LQGPGTAGYPEPLYGLRSAPVGLAARPGQAGVWIAYALRRDLGGGHSEQHAFIYHAGDATAADMGVVPATAPDLRLAGAADGRIGYAYAPRFALSCTRELLEAVSDIKHEYVDGYLYAMSGGTLDHDGMTKNVRRILGNHLAAGPPGTPYVLRGPDVQLHTSPTLYYYPDALVICGQPPAGTATGLHDATLVVEVLSDATATRDRGVWNLTLADTGTGKKETVAARALVNAAGPWVGQLAETVLRLEGPLPLRLAQGSHIVVRRLFDHSSGYMFQTADARVVFALPFEQDFTLIGTTDNAFIGDVATTLPRMQEINYLCEAANMYFREPVRPVDVVWAFAGIRSLYDDGAVNADDVTRDYVLALGPRREGYTTPPVSYDGAFLEAYTPGKTWYLSKALRTRLHEIGRTADAAQPAGTYAREIFARLLIDLAWASSRLEGNTYTRLDTQNLIEFGQRAEGKDATEAQMILNHKAAIELLVEHADAVRFNRYTMLNLHAALSENLLGDPSDEGRLRTRIVNITGTTYTPLGIPQKIEEYFNLLLTKADAITDPFEQAFFVMVQLPYLQPFADVNKRTSRLAANIPLITANLCPLSFVDIPQQAYVDAVLGVYELRRVDLLRDVFLWAYERSAAQYRVVREAMSGVKESKQALGAEVIAGRQDFAPPTLLAQASRLNFSTRLFNLIVTNVPGPQFPLYLLGRELQELVPVAFLPENYALTIAAMSYNGKLDFSLLGDFDALTVRDSTIAGNDGGGFATGNHGTVSLTNTIVASSANGQGDCDIPQSTVTAGGHDVIGNGEGCTGFTDGIDGNHVGTSANPVDLRHRRL